MVAVVAQSPEVASSGRTGAPSSGLVGLVGLAPPPQELPELRSRQAAVVDLVGVDCIDQIASFRAVLTKEVEALFHRHVLTAVRPVWPGIDGDGFLAKWQGGFDLYCSLALSCMVCSARRPGAVVFASGLFRFLGLDEAAIARLGGRAVPWLFRFLEPAACERAALASAWILVLDEALDEGMNDVDLAARPAVLAEVMRGHLPAGATKELRAVHAIGERMRAILRDADDAAHLARVVDDVFAWASGEVKNLLGEPDPLGVCHRTIGITASMDLLGWAVSSHAGPKEHQFLYRCAELGQMVDDWLDIDKDQAQGRVTPALTGAWSLQTMQASYSAAEQLLNELADEAGEGEGAYRRLVVRTFRGQMQHMVRCLVDNP